MLIKSDFEVPIAVDKVWEFCQNIPQVASCLPGAALTDEIAADHYAGNVAIRLGPVSMRFAGQAAVRTRDEANRTIVVDASGADEKGRGQAALGLTARLVPVAGGTRVEVEQDLQLSGAAAQYGRGMISDVSAVMLRDFATNMQMRIEAFDRGVSLDAVGQPKSASGFAIALQAVWMALKRVGRRFFLPYDPARI
jgi:carbon monoxide dehydrogenase subunit G